MVWLIDDNERRLIDEVRKRLYSEKTMNADVMRDMAHKLTFVLDHLIPDGGEGKE